MTGRLSREYRETRAILFVRPGVSGLRVQPKVPKIALLLADGA